MGGSEKEAEEIEREREREEVSEEREERIILQQIFFCFSIFKTC